MGSCDHDEAQSPEMDAAVAVAALAEHDLGHAAHHVAGALASAPHRPDLLGVLDRFVTAAGGTDRARDWFPLEGGTWYGAAAVHARLLADSDPDAAFDLLCQIAVVRPTVPYLRWALAWPVDPAGAATSVGRLLGIGANPGTPAVDGALLPALDVLAALRARSPHEASLWPVSSMLTRRAGRPTEAWALAQAAFERFPSWNSAVALANACKAVDRWDDAQDAWRAALRFDPADVSVRLDWGDALLDRWDLDAARAKYQEVLDRDPAHPWAVPSAAYVDWARSPSVDARLRLSAWADAHPEHARGRTLADQATPWVGRLPPPSEATLGLLPQVREGNVGTLSTALTHLESPSSQLAARRFLTSRGGEVGFVVSTVPDPDPRVPIGEPRWRLWTWSGTDASPALPPPEDPVAGEVLAKLASARFHAEEWLARGAPLAQAHGLDAADPATAEALLRAALHPPAGPTWAEPWDWQYRVVHAAAYVLAGFAGWAGTAHREALLSMVAVRNDWFAVAGVGALAERGRVDREVAAEVGPVIGALAADPRDAGYDCVGWPATCAVLRLGGGDGETLVARLRRWEDR